MDNKSPAYSNRKIIIEIELLYLIVNRINNIRTLDIIDLGSEEILLGYNWLNKHILEVNWFNRII